MRLPRTFSSIRSRRLGAWPAAFTILEVMIACGIFFIVGFSILEMVTRGLAAAKAIQQRDPDPGLVAAALVLTNQLVEGSESGDFEDMYPGLYRNYTWGRDVTAFDITNGLFQVDIYVFDETPGRKNAEPSKMSMLLYRPGSPRGSAIQPR